jgi:uncharacterized protein (DUF4415 family)
MKNKNKPQEIIVDVTEEEYAADLARGLQEDEVLHPGRHVFKRGGFLARHGLPAREAPAKVRISINLDVDVVDYFKERASRPHSAPYQTQINSVLREIMERDERGYATSLAPQADELLADPQFIEAVAERVTHYVTAKKRK